jgi:quinol monooxygenase YgiN
MYGLIGKITSVLDQRDKLIRILAEATKSMPGCVSYTIFKDTAREDVIWIIEVWDNKAAHAASLSLPAVQAAIVEARPMISAMERIAETTPV